MSVFPGKIMELSFPGDMHNNKLCTNSLESFGNFYNKFATKFWIFCAAV